MKVTDLPVRIPSYQRASSDVCTTPKLMRKLGFNNIKLYVRQDQMSAYLDSDLNEKLIVIPDSVVGIAQARQFIVEREKSPFMMIDDDVRGFSYKEDCTAFGGLRAASAKEIRRSMQKLLDMITKGPQAACAIVDRFTVSHPSQVEIAKYGFMRQCFILDPSVVKYFRFDRMKLMGDIDFSLQVAKAGVDMAISRTLCVETGPPARNKKDGGVGAMRDRLDGVALVIKLHKLHPDVVALKNIDPDKPGGRMRISWYGAYKVGQK